MESYGSFNSHREVISNIKRFIDRKTLFGKSKYTINDDFSVDVDDSVYFYKQDWIGRIPIKLGKVNGSVNIMECNNLTNLKGLPNYISGSLNISNNINLESLEGCPEKIDGDFICTNSKIETLEHGPKYVGRDFIIVRTNLTSLIGSPEKIGKNFNCDYNKLTNLIGLTKEVGNFSGKGNELTSLEGIPEKVNSIVIDSESLYNVDYFPTHFKYNGRFSCVDSPISLIFDEGIPLVGEYTMNSIDILRSSNLVVKGTNKIRLKHLKYFYHILDQELTEKRIEKIKTKYEII